MQKWAIPLLVLIALGLLARAQEIVPAIVPVPTGTPLPSSIRIFEPTSYFTDANPGVEGEFGTPTDDPNHLYVWHLSHWRAITLNTSIDP